jgi:hypothetical protein
MKTTHQVVMLVLVTLALSACVGSPQTASVEISVSIPCILAPGETRPLSLRGQIPAGAEIFWEAAEGEILPSTSLSTNYRAPNHETTDVITVRIVAGDMLTVETLSCDVKEQLHITVTVPSETIAATQSPQSLEEVANVPTIIVEPKEEPQVQPTMLSISITEVMADPCGQTRELETANEYVELYNYGDRPIDVSGWWLMDNGSVGSGQPDEIVAWETRNRFIELGADLITDSTVIAPGQYALVLAPLYATSGGVDAPYDIPSGTVILTIATGRRIGDDDNGLWGTVEPRDVIVLYVGTYRQVDDVVSTYGTPKPIAPGSNPLDIIDDGLDGIPRFTVDCYSAQRLNPAGPDVESNWRLLLGTPGYSHDR